MCSGLKRTSKLCVEEKDKVAWCLGIYYNILNLGLWNKRAGKISGKQVNSWLLKEGAAKYVAGVHRKGISEMSDMEKSNVR